MKIRLHTLSPLHIGTGEELAPLDYVVYGGQFYRLSQQKFLDFVSREIPGGAGEFSRWVSERFAAMKDIRDNRELSDAEGRMNAYYFSRDIGQEQAFLNFLRRPENEIFTAPAILDERTRQRSRSEKAVSLGRVREAIKNGRNKPLVPGSSLKGALRTAVFYHYLTQYADSARIERLVREQLDEKRAKKERFALPLAHEAFFCAVEDRHNGRVKKDDEKMDLFKLVRISDGHVAGEGHSLSLAKVNIYLVEKQMSRDRSKSFFIASQQPQASYCENITPGAIIESEIDFDIDFLLRLHPLIKDGAVPAGDFRQWIGIEEKVKQLFGLDLNTLTEANKNEKKAEVIRHLLGCLKTFSRKQLWATRDWLAHFEKNDPKDFYTSRIKKGFAPVFQREKAEAGLLHLGYATGFDGMTALLYFLADDRRKALFKKVMERFGLGNKPGNRGQYTPNPDRFPKSKRLVETPGAIQPMGWLEVLEEGQEPQPLPAAGDERSGETLPPAAPEPVAPAEPQFYDKEINFKRPPDLDAVVAKPGRPNVVKVYLRPGEMQEMNLMGYNNPLEAGAVLVVRPEFNKKGVLVQVAFRKLK